MIKIDFRLVCRSSYIEPYKPVLGRIRVIEFSAFCNSTKWNLRIYELSSRFLPFSVRYHHFVGFDVDLGLATVREITLGGGAVRPPR